MTAYFLMTMLGIFLALVVIWWGFIWWGILR
jgi:hypothetical protein